jgi:hypothetical protein
MKGTPCSSRRRATLKTLWETRYLARSGNPAKRVRAWAQSRILGATRIAPAFRPLEPFGVRRHALDLRH